MEWRPNPPKSLGRVYSVALQTAEKALFGPFHPSHRWFVGMSNAAYAGSSKNLGLEEEAERPLLFECQVETSSTGSCWWRLLDMDARLLMIIRTPCSSFPTF